jgi:hypothetical protein
VPLEWIRWTSPLCFVFYVLLLVGEVHTKLLKLLKLLGTNWDYYWGLWGLTNLLLTYY